MQAFPHSNLWIGQSRSVVISGPHIQVLNTSTGDIVSSTLSFSDGDKNALLKSGPIRCAGVDQSGTYIATVGDDKRLKVWNLEDLTLLSAREVAKRPTAVGFIQDAQNILVSDKFGDVFCYPLHPMENLSPSSQRKRNTSHDNRSGGELVLGHASLLTSFLLTPDERYIITADRDEHIRVSWYPEGYNIERFCLGHKKFVSAIHVPSFAAHTLISGGGDPMLKIWDWMSGNVLHEIRILEAVQPFIQVRPTRRRVEQSTHNDDDEADRREGMTSELRQEDRENDVELSQGYIPRHGESGEDMPIDVAQMAEEPVQELLESPMTANVVLVIHKIDALESEQARFIIFNAVGTTALFACRWMDEGIAPAIQYLDFCKPILDFIVRDDGSIFVLLDGGWNGQSCSPQEGEKNKFAACAAMVQGQLLKREHENNIPLLTSLNSSCLIPASPQDLQTLDLYSRLSSMPKNTEVEHDPMDDSQLEAALHGSEASNKPKELGKKALGRLKHKRALQEAAAKRASDDNRS